MSTEIKTTVTREPVKGEVATHLTLEQPRRRYVVRSATKDGAPDHYVVLGADAYGDGKGESMRIVFADLRHVASMLIAHADGMGVPE